MAWRDKQHAAEGAEESAAEGATEGAEEGAAEGRIAVLCSLGGRHGPIAQRLPAIHVWRD